MGKLCLASAHLVRGLWITRFAKKQITIDNASKQLEQVISQFARFVFTRAIAKPQGVYGF